MNTNKPSRRKATIEGQGSEGQGSELRPRVELGPAIKAKIGDQLRSIYTEVVNEGVPDRFAAILRGLDVPADGGSHNEPS